MGTNTPSTSLKLEGKLSKKAMRKLIKAQAAADVQDAALWRTFLEGAFQRLDGVAAAIAADSALRASERAQDTAMKIADLAAKKAEAEAATAKYKMLESEANLERERIRSAPEPVNGKKSSPAAAHASGY